MSVKKKKPEMQFKQINNVTQDELSDHLEALTADGYSEWTILRNEPRQKHIQAPANADGVVVTSIEFGPVTFTIVAWWEPGCPVCGFDVEG